MPAKPGKFLLPKLFIVTALISVVAMLCLFKSVEKKNMAKLNTARELRDVEDKCGDAIRIFKELHKNANGKTKAMMADEIAISYVKLAESAEDDTEAQKLFYAAAMKYNPDKVPEAFRNTE